MSRGREASFSGIEPSSRSTVKRGIPSPWKSFVAGSKNMPWPAP